MLVPNQIIETHWHPRNKAHLESKGYIYTHTGDLISVRLEDMMCGSKCKVKVICDYCGKEYTKVYKDYFSQRSNGKDCCVDCHIKKSNETNRLKYGGNSPFDSKEVREKFKKNFMKNHGVDHPSKLETTKRKVAETNLKRYGVEHPSQLLEFRKKAFQTMSDNNNVPVSKLQIKLYHLLQRQYGNGNVVLNAPFDGVCLDCLLIVNNQKIDVEYDGWYWHKDRIEQDKRRNYYLSRRGFKILRIRTNNQFPTSKQITHSIDLLLTESKSVQYIDLDIDI